MIPLFPYQVTGAEFLAARRFALLADEPRVGKTPAAIAACDIINAKSILVICPAVARADWVKKLEEYSIFSRKAHPMFSFGMPPSHPEIVTSYTLVHPISYARDYDAVILDESHALKGIEAKRTRAVLGSSGLAHRAKHLWFISGTPMPNHAAELWPMLFTCGVYGGSYDAFVRDFCTGYFNGYEFRITGTKNHEKLKALLSNFMLRRTFAEVRPDLPPIIFEDYAVICGDDWIPRFPLAEQAMADRLSAALGRSENTLLTLASTVTEMVSLRRYVGLLKLEAVAQRVEQLALQKIVVFAYHRDFISQLGKRLANFNPVYLEGKTPEHVREVAKHTFTHDNDCRLFIGQITAAGTNVDLSAADYCIIAEASWVPADNLQAASRIRNVNKTTPVTCEFISLANSVDERVTAVLKRKTKDISGIMNK